MVGVAVLSHYGGKKPPERKTPQMTQKIVFEVPEVRFHFLFSDPPGGPGGPPGLSKNSVLEPKNQYFAFFSNRMQFHGKMSETKKMQNEITYNFAVRHFP